MIHYLKQHVSIFCRQGIGLAFFLAWNFCLLYGCAVAAQPFIHYNLEYIWLSAGLCECLVALVTLWFLNTLDVANDKRVGIFAAGCGTLGTIILWLMYFNTDLFWMLFIVGALCLGIGLALMITIWGQRLTSYNEAEIEFTVLISFIMAFAIYCILLPIKLYGIFNAIVIGAFPLVSMFFAFHQQGGKAPISTTPRKLHLFDEMKMSFSVCILLACLWFLVAYIRVLATPAGSGNRYLHYLLPFAVAFAVTVCLFGLCVKSSRYLNFTLVFRWTLPFMLLSFSLLFFDHNNAEQRIAAYSINFIALFGMLLSYWISAPKYARRMKVSPSVLFLGLAAGEGLGIFSGTVTGIYMATSFEGETLLALSFFFVVFVFSAVMILGFNPSWIFSRSRHFGPHPSEAQVAHNTSTVDDISLDSLFMGAALCIQEAYGLTERETEVASLLLAGRSRPYIRDELFVSLNTVHAHTRNIFAKCSVHSQQELMDLGRSQEIAESK